MMTVLVVDDEPDILLVLEMLLSAEGYRVRTASSGTEALALVQAERPDLVLADVMMPGIDGFELMRRMANEDSAGIPVILMSAAAETVGRKVEPPTRFIPKPLDFDRLLALVRDVTGEG